MRWPSVGVAVVLLAGLAAGPVRAHSELTGSSPAAAEQLAAAPSAIVLLFDEELDPAGSQFALFTESGEPVAGVVGQVDLQDPDHARLIAEPVPALSDGVYFVRWTALSLDGDGEQTSGEFAFSIGAARAPAALAATAAPALAPPAAVTTASAAPAPADYGWLSAGLAGLFAVVLSVMAVALLRPRR